MPLSKLPILFVLTLLSFVLPAFSDPLLGPPREIAPVRIDAACGGRGYAAVATNGSASLVAWQDANARRVLFSILDTDGEPVSEVPRELPGFKDQTGGRIVAVATDGTDFVVGWISSTSNTDNQLHVASIRSNGDVAAIRQITASAPVDVQIAWNGSKFLLVYQNGISNAEVYGQFLERDSLPVGSQLKLGGVSSNTPAVAATGETFLVVFRSWAQSTWGISAVLVRASGAIVGPYVFTEAQAQGTIWDDDVTSDGEKFTVVWSDSTTGVVFRQIRARTITVDGLLSPIITLSDGLADSTSPAIASVGSGYVMTYLRTFSSTEGYAIELRSSRFNGQLEHVSEQTLDPSRVYLPAAVAAFASTAVVAWIHSAGEYPAAGQQVFASVSSSAASFSPPAVVSRAAAQQESVVVAGTSSDSLLAWVERYGTEQRPAVRAQLLSRAGAEAIRLSDSSAIQLSPAVAASPSDFLVVWIEPGASATLAGRIVDRNGTPTGQAPLVISTDVDPATKVAVSWGGDRYGVAFQSASGRIQLALLRSAGVMVVQVSADRQYYTDLLPAVAFDGRQFLVTWNAGQPISCPFECPMASDVRAARVLPDGTVLDPAPPRIFETRLSASTAPVVWDGRQFIISRADYRSVVARRMRTDGTLVDPIEGVPLTREVSYSFALTFDGEIFTLAAAHYTGGAWGKADILLKTFSRVEDAANTPFVLHYTSATSFDIASTAAGSFVLAEAVAQSHSPYFGSTRVMTASGAATASAPLLPPAAVTAYPADGIVIVQWQDRSNDETGFIVEEGYGFKVAEVSANQTIVFLGVEPGYHYYRVVAVRDGVRSEGSDIAIARTKMRHRSVRR